MQLYERVVRALRREAFVSVGGRVLVALSGGADSVALVHLAKELDQRGDLTLAGAAHLHHGLRGDAADEDFAFCERLAGRLGITFVSDRVDVAALARKERRSIEDAARLARYAFLEDAARDVSAEAIATAHTADDQAETFLLRILRGSGTRGLGAIRPRIGRVIRPLLDVRRDELRRYLADRHEGFREDASNADVAILRNRIRHELLPLIESRFSSGITDVLGREALLAQQDEDFLRREAIEKAREIVLINDGAFEERLQIDIPALKSVHPALASRVAHDVLRRLAGSRPISFDHVRRLLDLAAEGRRRRVSQPARPACRASGQVDRAAVGARGASPRGELFRLFVVYSRRGGVGASRLGHPRPRSAQRHWRPAGIWRRAVQRSS